MKSKQKQKPARAHHFVTQFHLGGFTLTGTKDGTLCVTNVKTGKGWESSPSGICYKNDLYRVEGPNVKPDVFENELGSNIEATFANALKAVVKTKNLPNGKQFLDLLEHVALSAARIPPAIKSAAEFEEQVCTSVLQMKMKNIDGIRVKQSQNRCLEVMLLRADTIFRCLLLRRWLLLIAEDNAGDFICGDNPVHLGWSDTRMYQWPTFLPGYAMPETDIIMPLTRRMALWGRFEFERPSGVYSADKTLVAAVNTFMVVNADRFVMSSSENFYCLIDKAVVSGPQHIKNYYGNGSKKVYGTKIDP